MNILSRDGGVGGVSAQFSVIAVSLLIAFLGIAWAAIAQAQEIYPQLVSVASDGSPGNGYSYSPVISADGTKVVFASESWTLVPGDTNGKSDIFVHDILSGSTTRVSVASDGSQGDASFNAGIRSDGNFVAFTSLATDLVAGDNNNIRENVFVWARDGGVERVSVAFDGGGKGTVTRPPITARIQVLLARTAAMSFLTRALQILFQTTLITRGIYSCTIGGTISPNG